MMTSLPRFLVVIAMIAAPWLLPALALSSEQLTVDVFNATINNTAVFSLPLDKLTDMLGRSSGMEDYSKASESLGPQIHYHHYGLSFGAAIR